MNAKFCTHCGAPLREGGKFCTRCGAAVVRMAAPQPVAQVVPQPEKQPAPEVIPKPALEVVAEVAPEVVPETVPEAAPEVIPEAAAEVIPETAMASPAWNSEESADTLPVAEEVLPESEGETIPILEPVAGFEAAPVSTPVSAPVYTPPAPVAVAPAMEYAGVQANARREVRPRGAGRTVLAVLLCIVLFMTAVPTLLLQGARSATSHGSVQKYLVTVFENLDKIPGDILPDLSEPVSDGEEWILTLANENGVRLTEEKLEKFIEDSAFINGIYDKMSYWAEDIYQNSSNAVIKAKDIEKFLEADQDLIEELFDERLSDHDIENIAETIEETGILEITDVEILTEEEPEAYLVLQTLFSTRTMGILAGIMLVLALLLWVVNRWNLSRTALDLGITLTVAGVLAALPSVVLFAVPDLLARELPRSDLIQMLLHQMLQRWLIGSLVVVAVAIVLIILGCVGKLAAKKK